VSPEFARTRTHIEEPIAAVPIAAELDPDRPVRVVELGFFGRGEIPIPDNVEIGRDLVDDGTPLPLEVEPGSRPDLPVATQQPLASRGMGLCASGTEGSNPPSSAASRLRTRLSGTEPIEDGRWRSSMRYRAVADGIGLRQPFPFGYDRWCHQSDKSTASGRAVRKGT
jgi:hypothetical protein